MIGHKPSPKPFLFRCVSACIARLALCRAMSVMHASPSLACGWEHVPPLLRAGLVAAGLDSPEVFWLASDSSHTEGLELAVACGGQGVMWKCWWNFGMRLGHRHGLLYHAWQHSAHATQ